MGLVTEIERQREPDVGPQGVLKAVQKALFDEKPKDFWQASEIARREILNAKWTPGHDFGQGRQYVCEITSASGTFILRAVIPEASR
jgi:hypothetical protein